jgi:hypothetical protein
MTQTTQRRFRSQLATAGAGLAAGLISSLAISAMMLLVEKVAQLPVGTFYLVLASALFNVQEHTVYAVSLGLMLHLAAGTIMGLAISTPFVLRIHAVNRYSPIYGLATGFVLWAAMFLPITYGVMIPLLNTLDSQMVIRQQVPTGEISTIATAQLLSIMDKVIAGSLAFNMFFGLLTTTLTESMSEVLMRRAIR